MIHMNIGSKCSKNESLGIFNVDEAKQIGKKLERSFFVELFHSVSNYSICNYCVEN